MAFRTQKISQMTPKGANLEATDLIEVSTIESGSYVTRSITGQEIIDAAVGNVDWGDIGGTLSAQTDLQNALDAKVPTSRTLTINGVTQDLSANRTFTISTGITIGSTAIASGTVGRILFEGAGNVVQESANLFWDATNNRLGIGTSTPDRILVLQQDGGNFIRMVRNLSTTEFAMAITNVRLGSGSAGGVFFANEYEFRNSAGTSAFLTINSGNVLINTTTDAGFRLDVNGTARVKTDLKIETATGGLTIEGDASGYPTLKINTLRSGTTRRNWMFATEQINGGDFILFRSATAGGVANTLVYSIFNDGNFGLNTSTNAGFRLDVNGTARVQGNFNQSGLFFGMSVTGYWTINNTGNSTGFGSYISQQGMSYSSSQPFCFNVASGAHATSASVQIDSTTKGFLPPRMTTTQKNAIASPAAGLMVYDTTLNVISYYNGSMWI